MPSLSERRRAYEAEVRALAAEAEALRAAGADDESVARHLVQLRNELKRKYRSEDDPAIVALMERRNLAKYGHGLGPDADWLFRRYGSSAEVLAAACRPAHLADFKD